MISWQGVICCAFNSKTVTRIFLTYFLLYDLLLSTFVFSTEDSATDCSGATKDCGCSKTFRSDSLAGATHSDHEKHKWTLSSNPGSSEHDHGLKYDSMVLLHGGDFFLGTNNPKTASDGEGPARKVKLDAFYMDKYEVCNHDFEMFVNKTGYITEVTMQLVKPGSHGTSGKASLTFIWS